MEGDGGDDEPADRAVVASAASASPSPSPSSPPPPASADEGVGPQDASDADNTAAATLGPSSASTGLADISTDAESECAALLGWVQAVERTRGDGGGLLSRVVAEVDDLCDGVALFEVLASIDGSYFRNPHAAGADAKDNWVLKIGTLKRLYKLVVQYYIEVLQQSPRALKVPDLDVLARDGSYTELARLGRLVIGIAVRSEHASEHIAAIQTLDLEAQQQLMHTIEEVMAALQPLEGGRVDGDADAALDTSARDTAGAASSDAQAAADERNFEHLYMDLQGKHQALQAALDEMSSEKEEATQELQRLREDGERSQGSTQAGVLMRQDIERLKDELRRSEDNLAEAEREVERLGTSVADMMRRSAEAQRLSEDNAKLKDQVDELKHAADKLQRTENVMEKYKKKLEEGSEIRRQLKNMEVQNAELIDRNAALEDENKRVAHFKPLMDSYKSQMDALESKASDLQRDLNSARYDAEQTSAKLRATEEARTKEKEELDLYQERVQELELGGALPKRRKAGNDMNGAEGLAAGNELDSDEDVDENLEDALSGTTMTGLKIQVRKLTRELRVARSNKADAGELLVAQNLLQDANRMKERYEKDYLREYQSALRLRKKLDDVQTGKSHLGDGPEANIALRMRLNETIEELDTANKALSGLENEHEQAKRELVVAKSDLNLVSKDKLEMINEVRASVNVEKAELERAVKQLREELARKEEDNRISLSQINTLLMDKVDLQNDSIEQRDGAKKRELEMGALRLQGQAVPEDTQKALEERATQIKTLQEKLQKARAFVRQQDRMIKEGGSVGGGSVASPPPPADDELARRNASLEYENKLLRQEQRLMSAAWYDLNQRQLRANIAGGGRAGRGGRGIGGAAATSSAAGRAHTRANHELNGNKPKSWLLQQRTQLVPGISLSRR